MAILFSLNSKLIYSSQAMKYIIATAMLLKPRLQAGGPEQ